MKEHKQRASGVNEGLMRITNCVILNDDGAIFYEQKAYSTV